MYYYTIHLPPRCYRILFRCVCEHNAAVSSNRGVAACMQTPSRFTRQTEILFSIGIKQIYPGLTYCSNITLRRPPPRVKHIPIYTYASIRQVPLLLVATKDRRLSSQSDPMCTCVLKRTKFSSYKHSQPLFNSPVRSVRHVPRT